MKILLTISETATFVSLSESKIRRLIDDKRFPAGVTIDGNRRWRVKDLEAWVEQLSAGETAPVKNKRGRPRLAI
jgi:excisionase family DNA binding protein